MRVRLYVPEAEKGKTISLDKEQIRHLKVLRVKEGEQIGIFDGKGHEYSTVYSEKVRSGLAELTNELPPKSEPKIEVTLAIAAPKGPRMDFLIEKVSELGVKHIVPIICSRSIVKPSENKIERLRRIIIEACAQSERSIVPTIEEPIKFEKLLERASEYDAVALCHKTGSKMPDAKKILIIIGPEGDFTPQELELAEKVGCKKVRLANTILRTETAGITAVAQAIEKGL